MPVTLNTSISWKQATGSDGAMLDELQPNIVKPHTRDFMILLFLKFGDGGSGREFLRSISTLMKSARTHLQEIEAFKANPAQPGTPYLGVGLTATGYGILGVLQVPPDASFRAGMQAAGLNDPEVASWDHHFRSRDDLHAVVAIGDATMRAVAGMHAAVLDRINGAKGVMILGRQDGLGLHNVNGAGIEHFGYVDGRSQPLFLAEDIENEQLTSDGISNWDPDFPLGQVIVPDPAAPDPSVHFGSYFVFRKLEQNVRRFKELEEDFADRLGIDDEERAGAMLVGRFEDGTPVTMQYAEGAHNPVPNNFTYDSDLAGTKCPFLGHIRKTNPRGSGGFEAQEDERKHLMARRGQTYGVRVDNPNDGRTDDKPEGDVGLLFMAFNSDIGQQFEFTQSKWANNPGFPRVPLGTAPPGIDPIIGQMPADGDRPQMTGPVRWGEKTFNTVAAVPRTVTMKGGEYFFMPSLAFLRSL